jgi:hypothetical protein
MSYMDIDYGLYSASAAQAFGALLFVFVSFFSSRSDSSGWIHLLLRERCLVRYRRARDYQGAMAGWFGGLLVFFLEREFYAGIVFEDQIL